MRAPLALPGSRLLGSALPVFVEPLITWAKGSVQRARNVPSGAKAQQTSSLDAARLKPCPFKTLPFNRVLQGLKPDVNLFPFSARLKSCPVTKPLKIGKFSFVASGMVAMAIGSICVAQAPTQKHITSQPKRVVKLDTQQIGSAS